MWLQVVSVGCAAQASYRSEYEGGVRADSRETNRRSTVTATITLTH